MMHAAGVYPQIAQRGITVHTLRQMERQTMEEIAHFLLASDAENCLQRAASGETVVENEEDLFAWGERSDLPILIYDGDDFAEYYGLDPETELVSASAVLEAAETLQADR